MPARLLTAVLCCLTCVSCTVIQGNATAGTYRYASIGGDVKGYAQTPSGMTAESVDNSSGFRELNKTARFGIGSAAAVGIAKDLSASWKSVTNSKTAAGVSKAGGEEATRQAAIAADLEKARILNPVEEAASEIAPVISPP